MLGQVAHAAQAEALQALGDPRADARERLDRRLGVGATARSRRAGVLAGEPGRRDGYGSPSQ